MTICPHCTYSNPLGNQFCQDCGLPLAGMTTGFEHPPLVPASPSDPRAADLAPNRSPTPLSPSSSLDLTPHRPPVIMPPEPPSPTDITTPFHLHNSPADDSDSPTMMAPMRLVALESAGSTSIGRQRNHNEDYFEIQTQLSSSETPYGRTIEARGLYILCDGMGGHASGEVASAAAVDSLKQYFNQIWVNDLPDTATLREGLIQANRILFEMNEQNSSQGMGRMGTTAAVVLLHNTQVAIAHVGDSRVYRYSRRYGLEQLTVDHEVGQQAILQGIDSETAYARPEAYQLTQALGPRDVQFVHPDVQFLDLSEDSLLLLCSDGISDHGLMEDYAQTHIEPLLSARTGLEQGVHQLIDLANEYNGHDNITVIAVRLRVRPNLQAMG
jgi:protein phosphatase